MTVDDLSYDRITPDQPGLILPVTVTATGEPRGSLRSNLVGRPGKQLLRWQGFRLDGTTGPIWPTREESATALLPGAVARLAITDASQAATDAA